MDTQNLIPIAIVKLINFSFYIKRILKWQNIVKEICINANSGHSILLAISKNHGLNL